MKKPIIILTLILATIFCFYGIVLADGGGPEEDETDCTCFDIQEPPEPTSGPFIWGTFTVAKDGDLDHYNIHATLRRHRKVRLFQWWRAAPSNADLCALENEDLKLSWARIPCDAQVEEAFGLEGTPVIVSIKKTHEADCYEGGPRTNQDMIRARILIRVVPTITCDPPD